MIAISRFNQAAAGRRGLHSGLAFLGAVLLFLAPAAGAQLDLSGFLILEGRTLDLRGTGVTDRDLAALHAPEFARVRTVLLSRTDVSDAALIYLRPLMVKELDLSGTGVSDRGLAHLRSLPLKRLILSGTQVTDEGLSELGALRLEEFGLRQTRLFGPGLEALRDMPLRRLDLASTPLVGSNLALLQPIATLELLDISQTELEPDALDHLGTLPALRTLVIHGVLLSESSLACFRKRHPGVQVHLETPTR